MSVVTQDCVKNYYTVENTSGGELCRNSFPIQCIQGLSTDGQWLGNWANGAQSNFCPLMIIYNIQKANGTLQTPDRVKFAQESMSTVFDAYYRPRGGKFLPFGTDQGTFQEYLLNFCSDNPAACNPALYNICAQYTRAEVEQDRNLVKACGCHMSSAQYDQYSARFAIPEQCDPLCTLNSTIKRTDDTGRIENCNSNICIIDNVTVDILSSDVGSLEFGQVCGGCSGDTSCRCIIDDVSINVIDSTIGDINLTQNCGAELSCYQNPPGGGPAVKVPCTTPSPGPPPNPISDNIILWIGLILLLLLLLLLVYLIN